MLPSPKFRVTWFQHGSSWLAAAAARDYHLGQSACPRSCGRDACFLYPAPGAPGVVKAGNGWARCYQEGPGCPDPQGSQGRALGRPGEADLVLLTGCAGKRRAWGESLHFLEQLLCTFCAKIQDWERGRMR